MSFPISLSQQEYEALVSLARRGATSEEDTRRLESFLQSVEKSNGIVRHFLLVQWQELNQPLPAGTDFPASWPPNQRASIELLTRPIARADVEALLVKKAKQPTNVLVTRDPAGILGWSTLDHFFVR